MVAICDWVRFPHHAEVIAPLNILSLTSSDVYKHINFQHFHKFNSLKIRDETVLGEEGGGGGGGRVEYSPSGPGVSSLLIVYVLKKSLSYGRVWAKDLYNLSSIRI